MASWCIYFTYAKITQTQTSRTNFATKQRYSFSQRVRIARNADRCTS